jgi:hypothetical protein
MTPEQRADARLKAAATRGERAEVRRRLKRGELTLAQVLADAATSDVIGKMKASALLEALPGIGKVRARQLMGQIGIAENRRVRGLGAGQRNALEAAVTA